MSDQVHHPLFARLYACLSPRTDAAGQREHRRELLASLSGRIIELGAGNGLNFPHYSPGVSEVVAVEPEDYLRERARRAGAGAPVPVTVIDAVADSLPFPDATFDAAVASLVLCTVPDQARALAEVHRVLRVGGELRFYEHVRPNNPRTLDGSDWTTGTFGRASPAAATQPATPRQRSAMPASSSSAAAVSGSKQDPSPLRTSSASPTDDRPTGHTCFPTDLTRDWSPRPTTQRAQSADRTVRPLAFDDPYITTVAQLALFSGRFTLFPAGPTEG